MLSCMWDSESMLIQATTVLVCLEDQVSCRVCLSLSFRHHVHCNLLWRIAEHTGYSKISRKWKCYRWKHVYILTYVLLFIFYIKLRIRFDAFLFLLLLIFHWFLYIIFLPSNTIILCDYSQMQYSLFFHCHFYVFALISIDENHINYSHVQCKTSNL